MLRLSSPRFTTLVSSSGRGKEMALLRMHICGLSNQSQCFTLSRKWTLSLLATVVLVPNLENAIWEWRVKTSNIVKR